MLCAPAAEATSILIYRTPESPRELRSRVKIS
jgi:hypothetical protein